MRRLILGLLACAAPCASASADESASKPLPSLALAAEPDVSPWHGLSIGTSVFGVVGGKGTKSFVGGDVTARYDRLLPNDLLLGVSASTGIAPGLSAFGPLRPYDFATAGARIATVMGRWTPYLTTDLVLAKPSGRVIGSGVFSGADTANDLFNSTGKVDVGARVGAGFDYALTNAVSVGLGVSVQRGPVAGFP